MAVDHGGTQVAAMRDKLSPAHCAAAAAEPKAYPGGHGADQPDDISKEGAGDGLPLHYAARSEC
jgi:hypothetical protein